METVVTNHLMHWRTLANYLLACDGEAMFAAFKINRALEGYATDGELTYVSIAFQPLEYREVLIAQRRLGVG